MTSIGNTVLTFRGKQISQTSQTYMQSHRGLSLSLSQTRVKVTHSQYMRFKFFAPRFQRTHFNPATKILNTGKCSHGFTQLLLFSKPRFSSLFSSMIFILNFGTSVKLSNYFTIKIMLKVFKLITSSMNNTFD